MGIAKVLDFFKEGCLKLHLKYCQVWLYFGPNIFDPFFIFFFLTTFGPHFFLCKRSNAKLIPSTQKRRCLRCLTKTTSLTMEVSKAGASEMQLSLLFLKLNDANSANAAFYDVKTFNIKKEKKIYTRHLPCTILNRVCPQHLPHIIPTSKFSLRLCARLFLYTNRIVLFFPFFFCKFNCFACYSLCYM